jgi:fengycin family lipopeptide synthetase D
MNSYRNINDAFYNLENINNKGIIYIEGENNESFMSYNELYSKAVSVLGCLQSSGLEQGEQLILQADGNRDFLCIFWACVLGGIIPVPVTVGNNYEHRHKLFRIWGTLKKPNLITDGKILSTLDKHSRENNLENKFEEIKLKTILLQDLSYSGKEGNIYEAQPDDIAFIQFSSGSTGDPKGVILTHQNLLTNIDAILAGIKCTSMDSSLSWMPLTHDMGLIGFHLAAFFGGINQYIMPTSLFIRHPTLWIKKANEHKVSIISSPNFGYRYFLNFFKADMAESWDLSHIRLIFNGAEPISINLCNEFITAMETYGLKKNVMFPVYGLAEASLAVTFPPVNEEFFCHIVDRGSISPGHKVKESSESDEGIAFIDNGYPVKNCFVRICDDKDKVLDENMVGMIQIKGKNVTQGFYNNAEETAKLITKDGWLNTGDLGFLKNGRLIVTGRAKDIIFVNGQNYYPHDIEDIATVQDGIDTGRIAACGVYDEETSRDKIVLFVLFKKSVLEFVPLAKSLRGHINRIIGLNIDDIIPVKDIPKTTSGKIQRYKLGENYKQKKYEDILNRLNEHISEKPARVEDEFPLNETEQRVLEIVGNITGNKNIGVNVNFFDLGVDSLKAGRIISSIQTEFDVNIHLEEVFSMPSVRLLAGHIDNASKAMLEPIVPLANEINKEFEICSLSSGQKRIYALSSTEEDSILYNIPVVMKISGKVDCNVIKSSFQKLIEKHSSLRTSFEMSKGEPVQKIFRHAELDFSFSILNGKADEAAINNAVKDFIKPFDLKKTSLFRVSLIKLAQEEHLLMIDVHHIICDGGSFEIIIRDFENAYKGMDIKQNRADFKDYVVWQEKQNSSLMIKEQEKYWLSRFKEEVPISDIPLDFKRPAIQSNKGAGIFFELDKDMTSKLKQLAIEKKTTLNTVLLSAYYLLLLKYTGQEDIVVGSPVAGRLHPDTHDMVGMFVNTLALRNYPSGNKTFSEFLSEVKNNMAEALKNQEYPFERLVDALNLKRDLSRNPLFDTVFVLQNVTRSKIEIGDLSLLPVKFRNDTSKFDITLLAEEINGNLCFELEYCSELFRQSTMESFRDRFVVLLGKILSNINAKICDLEIISEAEKKLIIEEFNDTGEQCTSNNTVVQLFEEQAAKVPDKRALVYKNNSMTYAMLNENVNKLAYLLKEKGVGAGDIIGIMLTPSMDMVVGVLAILKAGGVFLPIDAEYPDERIAYLLEDSKSKVLITEGKLTEKIKSCIETICLDTRELEKYSCTNPESTITPEDRAYLIYTSGSTGKPKGVIVEHKALMNLCTWHVDYYKVTQEDKSTKYAGFGFDASVWEIFPYIIAGSEIHIIEDDLRLDVEGLNRYFEENRITISFLPTQICEQFMKLENISLRALLTGGDKLRSFSKKNYSLYNNYGPTENTVVTTVFLVDKLYNNIPIGKPIKNCKLFVLDKYGKVTPIGIAGELCISGCGLAKGYLNNEELTKEKFVDNPYLPGQKMYMTGDSVKRLPDGILEFLGRKDEQVKIRGFRIEAGEIEAQLLCHSSIEEAVISIYTDDMQEKHLCAYFVATGEFDIKELKDYLAEHLPYYMLPEYFVKLEHIPLNQNGKVDRKALPIPEFVRNDSEYAQPDNEAERMLKDIWQEVLGLERISVKDNFLELGGHSLKATVLVSRIHKDFGVQVSAKQIFKLSTIRKLAQYLEGASRMDYVSIPAVEKREYYPVTPMQKGLYIQNQSEVIGTSYNMPLVLCMEGRPEAVQVENAFLKLVERHEVLRTHFEVIDGQVVQKISEAVNFKSEVLEWDEKSIESSVKGFVRPFDLGCAPLLRVGFADMGQDKHLLVLDMHHIISDGIAMAVILKEFAQLLNGDSLDTPIVTFKDYAVWQEGLLFGDRIKSQKEYWGKMFSGEVPVLQLPYDLKRPEERTFDGDVHKFELSEKAYKEIRDMARSCGTTANAFLFCAYSLLLYKYSRQQDMIIGSLVAGRSHPDLESMVGMFNNFLPIKVNINSGIAFGEFLKEVGGTLLNAYDNQEYPYNCILEDLGVKTDRSRNFLFDTMLIFHNQFEGSVLPSIPGVTIDRYELDMKTSKLDIKLDVYITVEECLDLRLEYNTNLFRKSSIERMAKYLVNIVAQALEDPEKKLEEFNLLCEEEKRQILFDFNDTAREYPGEKTLYRLLVEQAEKTPQRTAAVFENSRLTYLQLLQKSNCLAAILKEKGVTEGSIVGIMVERSPEMPVGIFAILGAGAAYMPMSPEYPGDRVRYMMQDSGAILLLTQGSFKDKACEMLKGGAEVLNIEDESLYISEDKEFDASYSSKELAYVIYTSGSTGKPKGAMIEHYSVINRINWMQRKYPIGDTDVILQKTPFTFDVSVWELFWWVYTGSKVCFLEPGGEREPSVIVNAIYKYKVTTMHFVPAMLTVFLDYVELHNCEDRLKSLKRVFASGEALHAPQVERFNRIIHGKTGATLHNLYGPTEATVDVSYFDCPADEEIQVVPIGKPIDNIRLYVLDDGRRLLPVGVPGELYISGDGVGRGYLNRPELTYEKFVEDPFFKGQRMYRTGDLAGWMPDGNIEYMGRLDHQVKIRGFRIELGEIEAAVLKHEGVKEVAVIDKKDPSGNMYLCCYTVCESNMKAGELKEFLSKELPRNMIPSCFVALDFMPLSQNGKLDRKKLPEPIPEEGREIAFATPLNKVQERLAAIWGEVLGVERVGIDDNFFDIGGHSLKAASMVSRIQKEFCVEIRLRDVFNYQTIRSMEQLLSGAEKTESARIKMVEDKEYYPLSSAQKRLFILYRIEGPGTTYNLPGLVRIDGKLDYERLENTFAKLVKRHETLRTSFELLDGEPVQRIHKNIKLKVAYYECSEDEWEKKIDEFVKPFHLEVAPLVRANVIKAGENRHYLIFDMHHIISDGVSSVVLVKDFVSLYQEGDIEPLKVRYREYVNWQDEVSKTEAFKKQEKYWLEKFEDEIPILKLPFDFKRPNIQSFEGERLAMTLDCEMAGMLKQLAKNKGTTLYMVLFAAYNILLHKYSGQEDIVVGSPVVGRSQPYFEKLIGMFVNTVAIRNYPVGGKKFEEFLAEVKLNALEAFENQDYQFEELVQKLNIPREISRNPLFDTVFVLQNMTMPPMDMESIKFTSHDMKSRISKFDITFEITEMTDGTLKINAEYCTRLFRQETIQSMLGHYANICAAIAKTPWISLTEIEILSEKEKNRLIYDMNDTYAGYPDKKTIDELFEEQVARVPENIAIVHEQSMLNYKELNEKSNRLAGILSELGVSRGSIVAVMLERSPEMIISALAILKAGGAYLPIDLVYPVERVEFMLQDSRACLLITSGDILAPYEGSTALPPIVDLQDGSRYGKVPENLPRKHDPEDLAYIIYTSGTTGRPKGVMIEHRNVVRLMFNEKMQFDFNDRDVWTMFHSFCFDFSVWEMYGALLYGGKLVIVPALTARDTALFRELLKKEKVTVLNQTPSAFYNLVSEEEKISAQDLAVRNVIFGGEALKPKILKSWRKKYPNSKLINMYGITETTVHVTYKEITEYEIESNISNIGKPIPTLTTYIMDRSMNLVPIGVAGELCVGGDGVGRGYLNRPELTSEKFVYNSYKPGERIYRSGDLARMLPDGDIEYLGRIDCQVKIRGFRIELGEIESEILKHENIKKALILSIDKQGGDKALCAYFVSEGNVTVGEIKEHLMRRLPEYMVPAYFIKMESFPLTSNGKLDRKKLPDPVTNIETGNEFVEPKSSVEIELSGLWKDLLGIERVGTNDNFFDVGGNSLLLVNMQSKLEKKYPGKVKVTDLFMHTTISRLAAFIESEGGLRKRVKIRGIEMPDDFFESQGAIAINSTYNFKMGGDTAQKIKLISQRDNVDGYVFSLAAYFYLLSKTAGIKKPAVQVEGVGLAMLKQIEPDMENIPGVVELINATASVSSQQGIYNDYDTESIDIEDLIKNKKNVAPLFVKEGHAEVTRDLLEAFGIVLELNFDGNQTEYKFNFSSRIKKEKTKEYVNTFSKLLTYLVNQYALERDGREVAASKE